MKLPDLPNLVAQSSGNALSADALSAQPYCGQFGSGSAWYLQFNLDPVVIGVLTIAAVWTGAVGGRFARWRFAAVFSGAVLWVSPLCPASATLLSLRAGHHLGVMLLFAPLIAVGWPVWARTAATARRAGLWALGSAIALGIWFWPPAYSAAWNSDAVYWGLQLVMLGTSVLFWGALFGLLQDRLALAILPACAITSAVMGAIGAVLTFAPRVLLHEHQFITMMMGISPLHDQQPVGLIVWLFGMVQIVAFAIRAAWITLAPTEQAPA